MLTAFYYLDVNVGRAVDALDNPTSYPIATIA